MASSDRADSPAVVDEKDQQVTREYLHQDETPEQLELKKREVALVRKLDCFIAPVMMLLMLISYLDRGNIGFAATQGMSKDINLKKTELNTAVSVFYIFYILAEVSSP
jgi:sugar phosphate permease